MHGFTSLVISPEFPAPVVVSARWRLHVSYEL